MKPEEAIEKLRCPELPDGLIMVGLEVRQKAIKALKKQIPKEPKYKKQLRDFFGVATVVKGDCPCCGKAEIYSNANYCPTCGQKLDWEKEKDNGR